jgi:hypothetical protein
MPPQELPLRRSARASERLGRDRVLSRRPSSSAFLKTNMPARPNAVFALALVVGHPAAAAGDDRTTAAEADKSTGQIVAQFMFESAGLSYARGLDAIGIGKLTAHGAETQITSAADLLTGKWVAGSAD